jgi:carbamoyltransferase
VPTRILGVHIGHDSGACLVVDGEVVADAAEERFSRIKHDQGLPLGAIDFCLRQGGIHMDDVDIVAVPTSGLPSAFLRLFNIAPKKGPVGRLRSQVANAVRRHRKVMIERPPIYLRRYELAPRTDVVRVDHHLAHAASAYYTSGSNDRYLIVTADGIGNDTSLGIWLGEDGRIAKLASYGGDGSLGWFYGQVTEALGWWHGDGEGKTMGLAPYGDASRLEGALDQFCPQYRDGELVRPHDFGISAYWHHQGAMHFHMPEAIEIERLVRRYGREHVAAEAQRVLERQMSDIIFPWLERSGTKNLACAGGVFLNVKLNQRMWYSGRISRHHIFPNPGDAGLAVGAALFAFRQLNPDAQPYAVRDLYWGESFSDEAIGEELQRLGLSADRSEDPADEVAEMLAEGKIVGWFQGRMESGPRALGSRSILMSPLAAENKDRLNQRVKFREGFRPFCPSMTAEVATAYIDRPRDEPFMITSFDVRDEKRGRIPAVVHVDGTLRPQIVTQESNPLYWRLIREFGRRTGEEVILNTSFNVRGEPIARTPRDALRCFYTSGMDALAIGSWLLRKPQSTE